MYYTYYTVKNFACGALYNTYYTNVAYDTTEPLCGSVLYRADSDQYPALANNLNEDVWDGSTHQQNLESAKQNPIHTIKDHERWTYFRGFTTSSDGPDQGHRTFSS